MVVALCPCVVFSLSGVVVWVLWLFVVVAVALAVFAAVLRDHFDCACRTLIFLHREAAI